MVLEPGAALMSKEPSKVRKRIEKIESSGDLTEEEIARLQSWETDTDLYLQKVAETLLNLRTKKGLYQKDIARILGRSKSWVGQVENAVNNDHRSVKLYASALGVEFSSVVSMAEYSVLREFEKREMERKLHLDLTPEEPSSDASKTDH